MKERKRTTDEDDALKLTFEQRSEEVTDIIERMPTGWTNLVTAIITAIVLVMVTLGCVIKYPDTVMGQISVTGEKAPVRLVASVSGRLKLLVENNTEVTEGACLGYIETGAKYEDVLRLDSICSASLGMDTRMNLPDNLELGALSAYYNDFVLAYVQYDQLRQTKVYDNMRRTLMNQQQSDRQVAENMGKEIKLNEVALTSIRKQYEADSLLHRHGALSEENLEQQHNHLIAGLQSNIELKSSALMKQSEISSIDIELAKVDVTVREEMASSFSTMVVKYNMLSNQIRLWKEQYLFVAPIDGSVQYLGFWRDNVHMNASTEVFSISPTKNHMIGELLIPSLGAGKVEVGQDVNVKFFDYPYDEYGYVRGKVEALSSLARNMESSEGTAKAYLVRVSFPEGLKTNFDKQLHLNFESVGTGEVITRERRLIQRLFDNLKARETK